MKNDTFSKAQKHISHHIRSCLNTKSQQVLADFLDVSRPTVATMESGHANPTLRTLCALADYIGCDMHELFEPTSSGLFPKEVAQKRLQEISKIIDRL